MSELRLQDYVTKIKDLVQSNRYDEAIAHCQYILRHHSKHIETYALLGQACLKQGSLREASESFQRALSADPENLIARVGLGLVYGEQGMLSDAIWHMERAFELAPGNAEVRRHLQQLYGQRDGEGKTRLKLTQGALGRLYSRNALYERAIGEFRAVLEHDPSLPDIQLALAEAQWLEGRHLEAVETCLDLVDALPNCLKANLILGEVWTRGGDKEAGEERLRLAQALDPENRIAQEMMGRESPLPPVEVLTPVLEAESGPLVPVATEPATKEEPPDTGLAGPEAEERTKEVADLGDLLDWIGEEPAISEEELVPEDRAMMLSLGAEEGLAQEGMADWLQQLTDEEPGAPAEPEEGAPEPTEEVPEWLRDLMDDEVPAWQRAVLVPPIHEVPFWEDAAREAEVHEVSVEEEPGETPEWLKESGVLPSEPAARAWEEQAAPEVAAPPETEAMVGVEPEEVEAEGLPQWLKDLGAPGAGAALAAQPEAEPEEAEPEEGVPFEAEAEDVPQWLRELGVLAVGPAAEAWAEEPAPEAGAPTGEELMVKAGAEGADAGELPQWLKDLGAPGARAGLATQSEAEAREEEPEPEEKAPLEVEAMMEAGPEEAEAEELPQWLKDLGAPVAGAVLAAERTGRDWEEESEPEEEVPLEPEAGGEAEPGEAEAEELPEWLRDLGAPVTAAALAVGPAAGIQMEEGAPPLEEAEEPGTEEPSWTPSAVIGEEAMVPLEAVPKSLLALVEAGILDEADVASAMAEMSAEDLAAQRAEDVPEWLRDLIGGQEMGAQAALAPAAEEEVTEPPQAEEGEPAVEETVLELPIDVDLSEGPVMLEEQAPEAEEAVPEEPPALEDAVLGVPGSQVEESQVAVAEEGVTEPEITAALPAEMEVVVSSDRMRAEESVPVRRRIDDLVVRLKANPRDYPLRLELSRLYREERDWSAALTHYQKLISARMFLPTILDDLELMLKREVEPAHVYQLMGDAYMQENALDKALEMYRRAQQALTKR